ncbi:MAG TPA: hypothetical protein VF796_04290 [Humisphaera sp.]
MNYRHALLFAAALTTVLSVAARPAAACSIPVFRYALERWQPEPYEAVLFHKGPLTAAQQASVALLGGDAKAPVNVSVTPVDVEGKLAGRAAKLWAKQPEALKANLPLLVLMPGDGDERLGPVHAGPLSDDVAKRLADSPLRRETAGRLLKGQTAVWVLVECGDKAKDDEAAKTLTEELAEQQKALKLPVIDPEAPGPKLHSPLPLRVEFSVLRLRADDEAERFLSTMLTFGLPVPKPDKPRGPVVVPVFGQGRALVQMEGTELTRESVAGVAKFLVGECSCQVKELNPGYDLMVAADWASILDEKLLAQPEEPGAGKRANLPDPVIGSGKPKGAGK